MVIQLIVGGCLEMTNNSFRVSLIYYLGVLGGALAFGVLDQKHVLVGEAAYKYCKIGYQLSSPCLSFSLQTS